MFLLYRFHNLVRILLLITMFHYTKVWYSRITAKKNHLQVCHNQPVSSAIINDFFLQMVAHFVLLVVALWQTSIYQMAIWHHQISASQLSHPDSFHFLYSIVGQILFIYDGILVSTSTNFSFCSAKCLCTRLNQKSLFSVIVC